MLGASFTQAGEVVKKVSPLIWLGLGVAIALLAIAALPVEAAPNPRLAMLLAYWRLSIALAGATLVGAVAVAYAFG